MLFLYILLAILTYFISSYIVSRFRESREYNSQIQNEEYEPLSDLTPAEFGILFSQKINNAQLAASLLDWKNKGIIKFKRIKSGTGNMAGQYQFIRVDHKHKLDVADLYLYEGIFQNKNDVLFDKVFISDDFGLTSATYYYKLMQSLQEKGYLDIDNNYGETDYVQAVRRALFGLLNPLYWIRIFGKRNLSAKFGTKKLRDEMPKIIGYKTYLEIAEKDRLQFHYDPTDPDIAFSAHLPYAVALGLFKPWEKELLGLRVVWGNK